MHRGQLSGAPFSCSLALFSLFFFFLKPNVSDPFLIPAPSLFDQSFRNPSTLRSAQLNLMESKSSKSKCYNGVLSLPVSLSGLQPSEERRTAGTMKSIPQSSSSSARRESVPSFFDSPLFGLMSCSVLLGGAPQLPLNSSQNKQDAVDAFKLVWTNSSPFKEYRTTKSNWLTNIMQPTFRKQISFLCSLKKAQKYRNFLILVDGIGRNRIYNKVALVIFYKMEKCGNQ